MMCIKLYNVTGYNTSYDVMNVLVLSRKKMLFIQCVFLPQGRDILEQLKALPKRNVSVRAVSSIPSVMRNSTDLDVLSENGHGVHTLVFCF